MIKIILKDLKENFIKEYEFDQSKITIGRNTENDIFLNLNQVSRQHIIIEKQEDLFKIFDLNTTNGTWINKTKISEYLIQDSITIVNIANVYQLEIQLIEAKKTEIKKDLQPKKSINTENLTDNKIYLDDFLHLDKIKIGRAPQNEVIIHSILVSRNHCELYKVGETWKIKDLNSTNGTFYNGRKLTQEIPITNEDIISIGNYIILLRKKVENLNAIWAENISKAYQGHRVVQSMHLELRKSTFTAIMGPSGCGKSTLLKMLNGTVEASQGKIFIENIALEPQNYDFLKKYIGYVPQDDILHQTLTLAQTLDYSAKLRLPNLNEKDRNYKIETVLKQLGIHSAELKNRKIAQLSGGQRKRVSIAIELLNEPKILFLDEPTSPLDPQSIFDFLTSIRNLVNNGITVIMVTHKPEDLKYVDNVIFLSRGGYLVYHNDKNKLLSQFNKDKIEQIFEQFDQIAEGKKYNLLHQTDSKLYSSKKEVNYKPKHEWSQLKHLTLRYLSSKIGDKNNIILTFIQPFAIAFLLCLAFDNVTLSLIFVMAITSIWLGANNAAVEIVNEINIFKRERQVFLNTHFYIISKLIVLIIFAVIQNLILISTLYLNYYNSKVEISSFIPIWFVMSYVSFFATLLGLLLSSIFNTSEKVMTALPLILIPQIIFSGVIISLTSKFKAFVSFFCISRWGTEFLARIQENVLQEQTQNIIYVFNQLNNYSTNMFHQLNSESGNFIWIFITSIILYIGIYKCLNKY